jgi:hypothetical protein
VKHINVRNKVLKNGKWFYSGSSDGYLRSIVNHILYTNREIIKHLKKLLFKV